MSTTVDADITISPNENETVDVTPKKPETPPPINLDESNDPSYTNLTLPYRVICRQRYLRNAAEQRAQFIKEIKEHENMQTAALNGVRIHRIFTDPIIVPLAKTHTVKLTRKEQMTVEEILRRS